MRKQVRLISSVFVMFRSILTQNNVCGFTKTSKGSARFFNITLVIFSIVDDYIHFCWIQRLLLEPVHGLPCRSISRDCLQEEPICTVQLCDPRGQDDGLELLEARLQQHHLARPLLAWTENLDFFFADLLFDLFFLEI